MKKSRRFWRMLFAGTFVCTLMYAGVFIYETLQGTYYGGSIPALMDFVLFIQPVFIWVLVIATVIPWLTHFQLGCFALKNQKQGCLIMVVPLLISFVVATLGNVGISWEIRIQSISAYGMILLSAIVWYTWNVVVVRTSASLKKAMLLTIVNTLCIVITAKIASSMYFMYDDIGYEVYGRIEELRLLPFAVFSPYLMMQCAFRIVQESYLLGYIYGLFYVLLLLFLIRLTKHQYRSGSAFRYSLILWLLNFMGVLLTLPMERMAWMLMLFFFCYITMVWMLEKTSTFKEFSKYAFVGMFVCFIIIGIKTEFEKSEGFGALRYYRQETLHVSEDFSIVCLPEGWEGTSYQIDTHIQDYNKVILFETAKDIQDMFVDAQLSGKMRDNETMQGGWVVLFQYHDTQFRYRVDDEYFEKMQDKFNENKIPLSKM